MPEGGTITALTPEQQQRINAYRQQQSAGTGGGGTVTTLTPEQRQRIDAWRGTQTAPAQTPAPTAPQKPPPQGTPGVDYGASEFGDIIDYTPDKAPPKSLTKVAGEKFGKGREAGIDYETGAPPAIQTALARASNPAEENLALSKYYGSGNYGMDKHGNWWVNQDGKKVSVTAHGWKGLKQQGQAMLTANPVQMGAGLVGSAVGAGLGSEAGPVGAYGGAQLGFMAGVAVGKSVDEFIKYEQGLYAKSPQEFVVSMANEVAFAGATGLVGPMARVLGRGVQRLFQSRLVGGVTPAGRSMAQELAAGRTDPVTGEHVKAVPPVSSYAPGAKGLAFKQKVRDEIAGRETTSAFKQNMQYIAARARGIFAAEGIHPQDIDVAVQKGMDTSAELSPREVGEKVTGRLAAVDRDLRNEAEAIHQEVRDTVDKTGVELKAWADQAPPGSGKEVAEYYSAQRMKVGQEFGKLYRAADRLSGNYQVVPMAGIRAQAQELAKRFKHAGGVPDFIKKLAAPRNRQSGADGMSFEQAHALRVRLHSLSETKGVELETQMQEEMAKMKASVQAAMDDARGTLGQQANKQLKETDELWGKASAIFHNAELNALVKELKDGVPPSPQKIARYLMPMKPEPGSERLTAELTSRLPPPLREAMIRADLGNMLAENARFNDAGVRLADGKLLAEALASRRAVMEAGGYTPEMLDDLATYANHLKALDGQIDVTKVKNPTQLMEKLKEATGIIRAADEFVKDDPIGKLTSSNPLHVDRAFHAIVDGEAQTEQAFRTITRKYADPYQSPEWQSVVRYVVQDVFKSSVRTLPTMTKTFVPDSIEKAIAKYTPRQQELLLPKGLKDDILMFAKELRFLFPEHETDFGRGQIVASILQGIWLNPKADWKYLRYTFAGWMADHPQMLHFFTDPISKKTTWGKSIAGEMSKWGYDRGQPPSAPPPAPARPPPAQLAPPAGYGGSVE